MSAEFENLLRLYYNRLFPYDPYIKWISYGSTNHLARREFSFTLEDDIYIRYLSFQSAQELKAEMTKRLPRKMDLGAVFNARPSDHLKIRNFQPQEKELVFDIDMTDYDDVRNCCQGAQICLKCWRFMTVAVKVLDRALREDFGFQHLLWVYSGRRGIHCWVSDSKARKLGAAARGAVAEYLQLVNSSKRVQLRQNAHPSIESALKIIRNEFRTLCLKDQDMMGSKENYEKVLAMLPKDEFRQEIRKQFEANPSWSGEKRWDYMYSYLSGLKSAAMSRLGDEIMLQLSYPRLDINVSKGLNHLLKSPFCVHPKTGRVCVPIDASKADLFNPENAPTLEQLAKEMDEHGTESNISKEWKKTSMREPMRVFEEFLAGVLREQRAENEANSLDY